MIVNIFRLECALCGRILTYTILPLSEKATVHPCTCMFENLINEIKNKEKNVGER